MTIRKIEEEPWDFINQRSAGTLRTIKNAHMEITAIKPITELKSFIIQINTKLNFALHTLRTWKNVNTENSVHSLIQRPNSLLNSLKSLSLTWTSTCFTLKLYGAHIERMTMKEMFVCMLITGKTTEESQASSIIRKICARTGIQRVSLLLTKTVVN